MSRFFSIYFTITEAINTVRYIEVFVKQSLRFVNRGSTVYICCEVSRVLIVLLVTVLVLSVCLASAVMPHKFCFLRVFVNCHSVTRFLAGRYIFLRLSLGLFSDLHSRHRRSFVQIVFWALFASVYLNIFYSAESRLNKLAWSAYLPPHYRWRFWVQGI